jgi:hypothetical protein
MGITLVLDLFDREVDLHMDTFGRVIDHISTLVSRVVDMLFIQTFNQ